ncbi:MAG: DUF362 domain-containing protein [Deltaproteobacteria bacterium]|nr:DUF362 domain-containing protein [Deltaproteobacteria bacterium]
MGDDRRMSRREFVKQSAVLGVALGCTPVLGYAGPAPRGTAVKKPLALVTGERVAATRKAIVLLGGMERFVRRGARVVVKPNMSFPHGPERATNTHPEVVAAVAAMCLEAGAAEVLVLDYPFNRPEPCLELSGIRKACAGLKNVHVFALTQEKFFKLTPVPQGKVLRQVKIMKDVLASDVLINLPAAKSHTTTGVSLGMKNLMGVIWDRRYFHSEVDINQAIADLSTAVRVDLVVLDASRALVSGGPSGPGTVKEPRTIIAGTDPVAVDAMGVSLVDWYGQRFSGERVSHIVAAQQMGLGTLDAGGIDLRKAAL